MSHVHTAMHPVSLPLHQSSRRVQPPGVVCDCRPVCLRKAVSCGHWHLRLYTGACRCIPVVFLEESRQADWYFHPSEIDTATVLLPPSAAQSADTLMGNLTALLPRVPAMRRAVARYATRMTIAWSDLDEDDHKAVGPDALDIALWGMTQHRHRDFGVPRPIWSRK